MGRTLVGMASISARLKCLLALSSRPSTARNLHGRHAQSALPSWARLSAFRRLRVYSRQRRLHTNTTLKAFERNGHIRKSLMTTASLVPIQPPRWTARTAQRCPVATTTIIAMMSGRRRCCCRSALETRRCHRRSGRVVVRGSRSGVPHLPRRIDD